MDFYGRLGSILSEALKSGELENNQISEEKVAAPIEVETEAETIAAEEAKNDEKKLFSKAETEKKVTHIDSADKEKAQSFNFSRFDKQSESKKQNTENPKVNFFNAEQFKKLFQESQNTEPKVQVYKFSQLTIPQNVLFAFNTIGIPTNSDFETAKKIYREKIIYYHPDKWINTPYLEQAQKNTQTLNTVWEIVENWFSNK